MACRGILNDFGATELQDRDQARALLEEFFAGLFRRFLVTPATAEPLGIRVSKPDTMPRRAHASDAKHPVRARLTAATVSKLDN